MSIQFYVTLFPLSQFFIYNTSAELPRPFPEDEETSEDDATTRGTQSGSAAWDSGRDSGSTSSSTSLSSGIASSPIKSETTVCNKAIQKLQLKVKVKNYKKNITTVDLHK